MNRRLPSHPPASDPDHQPASDPDHQPAALLTPGNQAGTLLLVHEPVRDHSMPAASELPIVGMQLRAARRVTSNRLFDKD